MKKFIPIIILILLLCNGCGESKKTSVQNPFGGEMESSENKNQADVNKSGNWENAYASFLDGLYNNNTSPDKKDFEFALLDLDKDGTDELIVVNGGSDLSVYTFNGSVVEVGHHDFVTGTTKFFVSSNIEYSGIFCFSVDGGYEWHRYIDIEDNQLKIEDLWNEDYSGISEVLGDKRDRIKDLSSDKALIQESKKVYEENQVLVLKDMIPSNYNSLEKTTEIIFTNKYKDNPIDKYIDKRLEDDNLPFSERRDIKRLYYMLWESEYDNVMNFIKEKCEEVLMKNKIIPYIFMLISIMAFAACISNHNTVTENNTESLLCTDGSMVIRNLPEIYYTIPNISYFNSEIKGSMGRCSEKEEYRIFNEGSNQLFAIDDSVFISISEYPSDLADYYATTYIISSKNNEITSSFKGNVVYISNQSKLVFYIRNNSDNQEKGGLYCCDITGKNERKIMNGILGYMGRDGEQLYFQSISNDKVEILMYNQEDDTAKVINSERYNDGMKITDFKVTDGIVNYIYGHYEGQLGDFNGKIVSVSLQGEKNELAYETMEPQFFVLDSKIYYCIYKDEKVIKYCASLDLNHKEQAEFDNILFNKEDKDTYVVYEHVNCFDKINVSTKSGKDIEISEDKLREMFETCNDKSFVVVRRMDIYEDCIYMNIELWERQADDYKEKFIDRKLVVFDIENNDFRGLLNNPIQNNNEKDNNIEIIEQDMDINGHSISVPLISGEQNGVQYINDMIIENIKSYIDEESNLYEFRYVVEHNDGRYISIIIETMRYRKPAPYPASQAHAINIDLKEKTMLYNDNLVSDKKAFCEDIKSGRYVLLSEDEIPNNIAYPAGYIENMELEEIEEMFENEQIKIFISNQSLGFIVMLPHAMGSYAVFERTEI